MKPAKRSLRRPPVRRGRKPGGPDTSSRARAIACARAADETLAENTLVLDLTGLGFVADFLIISSASSPPHFRAVANAIEAALEEKGGTVHHREGDHNSPWLLIDCHDVIVHIFDAVTRGHYDLERLWAEARTVSWKPRKTGAGRTKRPGSRKKSGNRR